MRQRRREEDESPARARAPRRRLGLTLVELLVAATLIGLLASAALPKFQNRVYATQRSAAMLNLEKIYHAQTAYMLNYGRYADNFRQLGVRIRGGNLLNGNALHTDSYTYTLNTFSRQGRFAGGFEVLAIGNLDVSDSALDILLVEQGSPVLAPPDRQRGQVIIVSDDIENSSTELQR